MLFRGDLVHCPSLGELKIVHDHLLVIDDKGYVSHVVPSGSKVALQIIENASDPPIVIPRGSFLLPTFCDLHLHAPQFLYQGTGLHLPLMQWLDEYAFKAEESLDGDPDLAMRVYTRLAARLIENGTGAVLLFGTIKEETNLILAEVMQTAGIRAFVGKLSMDVSSRSSYVEESADAALSSARSFTEKCLELVNRLPEHDRLIAPVLTPRFVPTCTDALLKGLGDLSQSRGLRIQSHMAEALEQVQLVKSDRGIDDIEVFSRSNLLTPRTVQAHCTFLDPPSLARVAECGTAVAHCPQSNAYFSAEPFPLREALHLGVKVGLGSDIAGGYSIDIMDCMRRAVAVSRMREGARVMGHTTMKLNDGSGELANLSVDWKETLYLATSGGAIALGLPSGSNTFTVGAPFDAQCIHLFEKDTGTGIGPLDFFHEHAEPLDEVELTNDMIEKWWCIGDVRNRGKTWVQGRRVAM
ncbi:hypothetical protein BKA93DRAFT_735004 [Sparassis latifolia]